MFKKRLWAAVFTAMLSQCTPAPALANESAGVVIGVLRDGGTVIRLFSGRGPCPEHTGLVVSTLGNAIFRGCWIRNRDQIAIRWQDGDVTFYRARVFGFGPTL